MEMKLNIYKNQREIKKTYTADTYDVMYGTVEDLLNMIDLDALTGKKGNASVMDAVCNLLNGGREAIKPLLKDIFPGLTDDELRRVKAKELLEVLVCLTGFSMDELKSLYTTGKKVLEGQKMR